MADTPAQRRAAAGLFAGPGTTGAYDTRTPGVGFALPIPAPTVRPLDDNGFFTPVWYQWFLSLSRAIGTSALTTIVRYSADGSAVIVDPGQGDIRWNSGTQINATKLAISDRAAGAGNPRLRALWTRVLVGDRIFLQDNSSNGIFQVWTINNIVDHSTWFEIDVERVTSGGGNLTGQIDLFLMRG